MTMVVTFCLEFWRSSVLFQRLFQMVTIYLLLHQSMQLCKKKKKLTKAILRDIFLISILNVNLKLILIEFIVRKAETFLLAYSCVHAILVLYT